MRAGSLFSGVGGMDLGLHRAGFTHEFFCESDPWRRTVLAHHWPGVPIYEDVRLVGKPAARAEADGHRAEPDQDGREAGAGLLGRGDLELICGGFPCQDLSVAGARRGLEGSRSGLFYEFARIIDALRPRHVLIENVPGLLSSNGGRDFGIVLGTLADLGYGVAWRVLDSRFFRVPQRRRRVFILAADADGDPRAAAERCGEILAVGTRCTGHIAARGEAGADAAEPSVSGTLGGRKGFTGDDIDRGGAFVVNALVKRYGKGTDSGATDAMVVAAPLTSGGHPNSNMPGRRKEDDVNLVPTEPQTFDWQAVVTSVTLASDPISAVELAQPLTKRNGDPGVIQSATQGVRRLTPVECERLQNWPDGWTNPTGDASDSRRYAACGDGVTASVSEWIGRRLITEEGAT